MGGPRPDGVQPRHLFGIGSIIAASLVARDRQASAIAFMFSGLTMANLIGVPAGTWLAQVYDRRLVFWLIAGIGLVTALSVALLAPRIAGLTIAEHLPWDAINPKAMLERLPLVGRRA
ncbi:MFS transporter [Paracoccus aminovorans]